MKEVSAVSRLPAQHGEPGLDGSVDELEHKLIPVEEDELPQGVQDLVAILMLRHRPTVGVGRSDPPPSTKPADEQPVSAPRSQLAAAHQRPAPALQRGELALSMVDRVALPTPESAVPMPLIERLSRAVEPLAVERSSRPIDSSSIDQPPTSGKPAQPTDKVELPGALPTAFGARNPPSVAVPVAASTLAMPTMPPLEIPIEETVVSNRDFLQVPFNKGAASGQVTITRTPGDLAQNLVLSPSNPQVLEQLKEPFQQVRDSHWRLSDTPDERQHRGSQQPPDDEREEHQESDA